MEENMWKRRHSLLKPNPTIVPTNGIFSLLDRPTDAFSHLRFTEWTMNQKK